MASATSTVVGAVDVTAAKVADQDGEVKAAFAGLRQSIDDFEATGEVTGSGAARMLAVLGVAESYVDRGLEHRAVLFLGTFKQAANDPVRVPGETARLALTAAADELIALLS